MKRNNEEHLIQCGIIDWYDLRYGDGMLIAIPNGGARDARTGAMLKREGVRPGVWDLFLARRCLLSFHPIPLGLWIEVKHPGRRNHKRGGLTVEQWQFWRTASQTGRHQCDLAVFEELGR
jgi:hypothetical protein